MSSSFFSIDFSKMLDPGESLYFKTTGFENRYALHRSKSGKKYAITVSSNNKPRAYGSIGSFERSEDYSDFLNWYLESEFFNKNHYVAILIKEILEES